MKSDFKSSKRANARTLQRNLLALAVAQAISGVAHGADILVADFGDVSGANCTLRDAVASANSDGSVGGCVAGNGTDTITFDLAQLPNTIVLGGTPIILSSPMTIQGSEVTPLTISGNLMSRIFEVQDNTSTDVPITLDTLTLTQADSSASGAGGALINFEDLTINRCTFSDNNAPDGGALDNRNILTLTNSTLSGNLATNRGGAITHYGQSLTITSSTLSQNTANGAFGALVSGANALTITNTTIANNFSPSIGGIGLFIDGETDLINSIISDNDNGDCSGLLGQNISNMIKDGTCQDNAVDMIVADPFLGPLQDNGGPTQTHELLSQAPFNPLDSANAAYCPPTDQRGFDRLFQCDRGSYEDRGTSPTIVVNTINDVVANNGECSLREAVVSSNTDLASGNMPGECAAGFNNDDIEFDPAIVPGTITLGGSDLTISSTVTITGPGADQLTISGNDASRIFDIPDNPTAFVQVALYDLTLSSGFSGDIGGAVRNFEYLLLSNSMIINSTAQYGGAVDNRGIMTISKSTLSNNMATGRGGAISHYGSNLNIQDSTISGNTAAVLGGAITGLGNTSIFLSTVANNSAPSVGGMFLNGNITMAATLVADNSNGDCLAQNPGFGIGNNDYNLVEDGSCSQNATNMIVADPLLGPLGDNGGTTLSHAIPMDSPAVDVFLFSVTLPLLCDSLGTDQIGQPRPFDGNLDDTEDCDIGAFEFTIYPLFADGFESSGR